jgi:hypothetical protein
VNATFSFCETAPATTADPTVEWLKLLCKGSHLPNAAASVAILEAQIVLGVVQHKGAWRRCDSANTSQSKMTDQRVAICQRLFEKPQGIEK